MRSILIIAVYFYFLVNNCCCKKDEAGSAKEKVVVVLGSSTAFGIAAHPIDSSWPNRLASKFLKDNKKATVLNLAERGFTTYHVLPDTSARTNRRPAPDVNRNITKALSYKPELIIINLPSNDIHNNYSDDEILTNYKKIINEVKPYNIAFLITSTQPRNFSELNKRKRLKLFNSKMEHEYSLNFIDFYDSLADLSYNIRPLLNSGDGIHLNNSGHKVIFEHLFKNKLLLQKTGY